MLAGYDEFGHALALLVLNGYQTRSWAIKMTKGIYPSRFIDHWLMLASKNYPVSKKTTDNG